MSNLDSAPSPLSD